MISVQPQNQIVMTGANVTFSVTAEGTAPLSFQWQRNNMDLISGGNVSGATTATLSLADVQRRWDRQRGTI